MARPTRGSRLRCSLTAALFATLLPTAVCCAQDQQTTRTAELQALVERLGEHLRLRGDVRGGEVLARDQFAALAGALEAWNASARSDDDAEVMEQWLRAAIDASMFGPSRQMPPQPRFSERMAAPDPARSPAPVTAALPGPRAPAPRASRSDQDKTVVRQAWEAPPKAPTETAPPESSWTDHPAMAELEWGDPFLDDPAREGPAGSEPHVADRRRTQRFKPVADTPGGVGVDLTALAESVSAYNSKVRDIEGVLVNSRQPTAFRLAAVVRDLEELRNRRGFLQLYLDGLSPVESQGMPRLVSPEKALRLASDAADSRGKDIQELGTDSADAERAVLRAVSRKLSDLSGSPRQAL